MSQLLAKVASEGFAHGHSQRGIGGIGVLEPNSENLKVLSEQDIGQWEYNTRRVRVST